MHGITQCYAAMIQALKEGPGVGGEGISISIKKRKEKDSRIPVAPEVEPQDRG